jgi:predicted Zn-dependent protease
MVVRLSLKSDNLDVAKPIIDKLTANFPEDVIVAELEAKYALQSGEYASAASLFGSLFERHETNFVLVQWANALVMSGQDEQALEQLGGWLKKYPNDLLVLNVLANEYLNRNQLPEAKAYFTVITELNPENALSQNNLAWLLYKEGEISQAQIHAELAYEAFPDSPMIVDTLGQILLDQGEYERSKLMLRLANKKMSDNLETKYYLAQATAQGGDKATARTLLKQILSQKNNNSEAEQKLQRESQILLAELGN